MLLQVMGDGRLTDALGRTADFTNAILILTSNLGVKEASSGLGYQSSRANESSAYVEGAEKFFSPEFFNRLDRVVPFDRLSRRDGDLVRRIGQDRANVIIVAEPGAGKTTALVEAVRQIERQTEQESDGDDASQSARFTHWLTSGARLIAGIQ